MLLHLPSHCMVDDGRPACAAAFAANRRMCVLYLEVSYPPLNSMSRKIALIAQDVSGHPA